MWPFDRIAEEWPKLKPMIDAAPTTILLVVLALLAIGYGVSSFLNRREKNALIAEGRLKNARIDELKEETDRQANKIAELARTPALSPAQRIGLASTGVQQAALEIVNSKSVKLYGDPAGWTDSQLQRLGYYIRLGELGAAEIAQQTAPTVTTVTSASNITAAEILASVSIRENDDKLDSSGNVT
jgi:hypothetical protein